MPTSIQRRMLSWSLGAPTHPIYPMFFLGLFLTACGGAENQNPMTYDLLPETVGAWARRSDPVTYDRESIFDYINGAGEVYRSYDFRQVLVDRYETPEGLGATVEVFDMGNPRDAFGVFSYAREEERTGIGAAYEQKGSVLCFWQDRFYVCVAAEQRDPDPGPLLMEIASAISGVLPPPGSPPDLMGALPAEGIIPFSDRFFHNHQSLNYHYYVARENVLQLSPETDVALARYQPGATYLVVVRYPGDGEASEGLSSFRAYLGGDPAGDEPVPTEDGRWVFSSAWGPFVVVVLGAETGEAAETLGEAAMDNLSGLPG